MIPAQGVNPPANPTVPVGEPRNVPDYILAGLEHILDTLPNAISPAVRRAAVARIIKSAFLEALTASSDSLCKVWGAFYRVQPRDSLILASISDAIGYGIIPRAFAIRDFAVTTLSCGILFCFPQQPPIIPSSITHDSNMSIVMADGLKQMQSLCEILQIFCCISSIEMLIGRLLQPIRLPKRFSKVDGRWQVVYAIFSTTTPCATVETIIRSTSQQLGAKALLRDTDYEGCLWRSHPKGPRAPLLSYFQQVPQRPRPEVLSALRV